MLTEITLPDGTTLATTADPSILLAQLTKQASTPLPTPSAPAVVVDPVEAKPRQTRRTTPKASKVATQAKPKASTNGKAAYGRYNELLKAGQYGEAVELATAKGWRQAAERAERLAAKQEAKPMQEAKPEAKPKAVKATPPKAAAKPRPTQKPKAVQEPKAAAKPNPVKVADEASPIRPKDEAVVVKRTTPKAKAAAIDAKVAKQPKADETEVVTGKPMQEAPKELDRTELETLAAMEREVDRTLEKVRSLCEPLTEALDITKLSELRRGYVLAVKAKERAEASAEGGVDQLVKRTLRQTMQDCVAYIDGELEAARDLAKAVAVG